MSDSTAPSPGSIFLEIISRVSSTGLSKFAALLRSGDETVIKFAQDPEAIRFLTALNGTAKGKGLMVQFLAAPEAINGLAENGQAEAVLALIEAQPLAEQAKILAAPDAINGLAENGQAEAVLALIEAQPLVEQAKILAAPDAIYGLAENGQVEAVLALIEAQPLAEQAKILAAPDAINGLAYNGQVEAVLALIEAQPLVEQAKILTAPSAIRYLTRRGKDGEVERLGNLLQGLLTKASISETAAPSPA